EVPAALARTLSLAYRYPPTEAHGVSLRPGKLPLTGLGLIADRRARLTGSSLASRLLTEGGKGMPKLRFVGRHSLAALFAAVACVLLLAAHRLLELAGRVAPPELESETAVTS